jgi:leader peptidase (prepilin peptidase)/N-methyltransferase
LDRFFECALFVIGLAFGSFLNVCVSRLPREQSIVSPPSHCPFCGAPVRWWDNVPLVSWIVLRGRCRDCGERISIRYPVVELLTAVLFTACYVHFGLSWLTLKFCVFCFLVLGLIFMDAETGLLPREFTYTGIVLGVLFSWWAPTDTSGTQLLLRILGWKAPSTTHALGLLDSVLGAAIGAGFFYLAWAVYYLIRKRHGLGFGDIALMAMAGAFLGLKLVVFVLFTAPVLGAVYAIFLLLRSTLRKSSPEGQGGTSSLRRMFLKGSFSFGVCLGVCSLAAVFAGEAVWRWYLGFF